MGTQGIVSVLKKGKVVAKAVAGCDGNQADALAAEIKGRTLCTPEAIMEAAKSVGFGSRECLVVQGLDGNLFGGDEDLGGLYLDRTKFADPRFNPRWSRGLADHVKVVDLGS